MTAEPEDDLTEWSRDFRATTGGVQPPSPEPILERAARDARRERLEWVVQIGGTAFAVATFVGLVVITRSPLITGFAAFVLPVLFALFAWFVVLRVRLGGRVGSSLADHVAAATRRNRARHQFARANLATLVLLATGFWVWLPLFVLSKSDRFAAEPWRLGIAVTVSLLVFGLGLWRASVVVKRARAELESWRSVGASLQEPPGD
jgi:hypothetical protein